MRFTGDELVLALISLVRATHPRMLRQEVDGFSVDFEPLSTMKQLGPDERLMLKMRTVIEPPSSDLLAHAASANSGNEAAPPESSEGQPLSLDLAPAEARRLAQTLARLETLQRWPADVLEMSRALRARLTATH
jgi:hypothetical protein